MQLATDFLLASITSAVWISKTQTGRSKKLETWLPMARPLIVPSEIAPWPRKIATARQKRPPALGSDFASCRTHLQSPS